MSKAIYSVMYRDLGNVVRHTFDTFAAAAGAAEALAGVRFIDVEIDNVSGSLYVYNRYGKRRVCNEFLLKQVINRKGE